MRLVRLRQELSPGRARVGWLVDVESGAVLDEAVVTLFRGPHSYTSEDVVEIAVHGAPVLLDLVVRGCVAGGARLAEAGEFTRRAFLSGRLDLTQAEAVHDLVAASTLEQARIAAAQLGGSVAKAVAPVKRELVGLIAGLEAGVDFAEDDLEVMGQAEIVGRIEAVREPLATLARSFRYGRMVREGFTPGDCGTSQCG